MTFSLYNRFRQLEKVRVDKDAFEGYLGATSTDGVLRTSSPLTYTDGGNYITLGTDIKGTDVELNESDSASYNDVQDFVNTQSSRSKISGGDATNTGSGVTCTISEGTGMIRTGDTYISPLVFFDWDANASVPMTDNSINYVYINYNNGTPVVVVNTDQTNLIKQTYLLLAVIWRDDAELHIINVDPESAGGIKRAAIHHGEEVGAHRVSGLLVSNSGTQRVAVSQGVIYAGLTRIVGFPGGFDSNNGHRFKTMYTSNSGTSWTETSNVQDFPDEQYNNITSGLVNLGTAKYGILWVYVTFDGDSLYMQYGQGNYNQAQATAASPPSVIFPEMAGFGILIAKLVFQKGAGTFTTYTPWETVFSASLATDHGNLAGLGDNDHGAVYFTEIEINTWRNSVTQTEMGYLNGVTSDIQTQIDAAGTDVDDENLILSTQVFG